jgi:hypothetical protein
LRIASQNTIYISSNIDVSYATEYNENFKDGEMVDFLTILAFGFHHHKCQVLLDCRVYDSNSDIFKLVLKDKSNHSELRSKETAQADKQSVSLSPSLFGPLLPTAL